MLGEFSYGLGQISALFSDQIKVKVGIIRAWNKQINSVANIRKANRFLRDKANAEALLAEPYCGFLALIFHRDVWNYAELVKHLFCHLAHFAPLAEKNKLFGAELVNLYFFYGKSIARACFKLLLR